MKFIDNIMDVNTLKIYGMNAAAYFITISEVHESIKILISVAVLSYTIFKALNEYKKWRGNKLNEKNK